MIVNKAKEFADISVVFTADMNVVEGSDNYKQFVDSGVLKDTKYLAETVNGGNVTFHGYSELAKKEAPIDFIFVNNMASNVKSYTVDTTEYNGIFASDHHPVISQMTLINA